MRPAAGFTLIGVLAALAILAVALAAAVRSASIAADGTPEGKERLLATENGVADYAARPIWPEIGTRAGHAEQRGVTFAWRETVTAMANPVARAQADTVARAATCWAAAILAEEDASVDHLNETWARRLPAIPADGATLTGTIADEQAKFNLNNLVRGTAPSPADVVVLQRLLEVLGLPALLADAIVDWIDPDDTVAQSASAADLDYLVREPAYRAPNRPIADVAELARVKGMTPEVLARLVPYVTALPDETPVNVNTASATVLLALVPSLSAADAARLVEARGRTPFRTPEDFQHALPQAAAAHIDGPIDVKSRFFSAETNVRVGRVAAGYRALIERGERGRSAIIALTKVLP